MVMGIMKITDFGHGGFSKHKTMQSVTVKVTISMNGTINYIKYHILLVRMVIS